MSKTPPTSPIFDRREEVRDAAIRFVDAAWDHLTRDHVIPRPIHARYLRVGRDYSGPVAAAEFQALEDLLNAIYPRFAGDALTRDRDFAPQFIYSLIEAVVARSIRAGHTAHAPQPLVESCVDDFLRVLGEDSERFVCARPVAYLRCETDQPLTFSDITVIPVISDHATIQSTRADIYERLAFGTGQFVLNEGPFTLVKPQSVVVAFGSARGAMSEEEERTSERIQRFLTAIRLLTGATCHGAYEVRSAVESIRFRSPCRVAFRGSDPGPFNPAGQVWRSAVLTAADADAIEGIAGLVDLVENEAGMWFSSMSVAISRYTKSFHTSDWSEQLVELATALEGALSGSSASEVGLRLRTRGAALLATSNDPAAAVYEDIKVLYDLRSTIVHGGNLTARDFKKRIGKVTSVDDVTMLGVATAHAIDRLRDIVRRAILCRLALAAGDFESWPIGNDTGVDVALADNEARSLWAGEWRRVLAGFGAERAADAVVPAKSMFDADLDDQPRPTPTS